MPSRLTARGFVVLSGNIKTINNMEKYCISIDWLQVCCHCNYLNEGEYKGSLCTYNLEIQSVETAMFKKLYSIKRNGLEVATIQYEPRPKSLNPKLLLLKLSNRVLYSDKYIYMLYDLISKIGRASC